MESAVKKIEKIIGSQTLNMKNDVAHLETRLDNLTSHLFQYIHNGDVLEQQFNDVCEQHDSFNEKLSKVKKDLHRYKTILASLNS